MKIREGSRHTFCFRKRKKEVVSPIDNKKKVRQAKVESPTQNSDPESGSESEHEGKPYEICVGCGLFKTTKSTTARAESNVTTVETGGIVAVQVLLKETVRNTLLNI